MEKEEELRNHLATMFVKFLKTSFLGENLADEIGEFLTHLETVSQK